MGATSQRTCLALLALAAGGWLPGNLREVSAQLAITEVMPWASTNLGSANQSAHSDYWELTNFSTNSIDLAAYTFCDGEKQFPKEAIGLTNFYCDGFPCENVIIGPMETIILVRAKEILNAQQFRDWWGEANLPEGLQIFFYPMGYGFNEVEDGVHFGDPDGNLVDRIEWKIAERGVSFEYEPTCGLMVQNDSGGNCFQQRAVLTNDVGSPGRACGAVPLGIVQHPASQEINAGDPATLCICVCGTPKPRYRWLFNGVELTDDGNVQGAFSSGLHSATLQIQHVDLAHAGDYSVTIDNGLQRATSAVATLTVRTNAKAPVITTRLADVTLSPDQQLTLKVTVEGFPRPMYQWYKDGAPLARQTNSTLAVAAVSWNDAGEYCIVVENSMGATNACAQVSIVRKPHLLITEAMSLECSSGNGKDWWELTNMDTNIINLRGYRWDDWPAENPAVTIGCPVSLLLACACEAQTRECHDVFIRPGESIVFVEGMTRAEFVMWWGAENLPRDLQIITYNANGFSEDEDRLRLWNATASTTDDDIDFIGLSTGIEGFSWWFDNNPWCGEWGVLNVPGQCGAFLAANGCDIGSPGWTQWTGAQITDIAYEPAGIRLTWKSPPGTTNVVEYTSGDISNSQWATLGGVVFGADALRSAVDTSAVHTGNRFYRVLTTANCRCE